MSLLKAKPIFNTTLLFHGFAFSSTANSKTRKLPTIRCINRIQSNRKAQAVEEAQKALREYLHATKSLPFVFAELIANNSPFSLSNLLRKVRFSARTFYRTFKKLLRYEPINEFEFFLESIGIDYRDVRRFLPPRKFFFSEDGTVLGAACALSQFGFPWNRLGKLYEEEVSIFRNSSAVLTNRLCWLKERYGIDSLCVAGVCLAYPRLLRSEGELSGDIDALLCDLKRVSVEFDEGMCVEGNVDAWYELCRKVRIFHDLGCEKGKVGELMCANKQHLFGCSNEVLVHKVQYFDKFCVSTVDVGLLLLRCPEILSLDLDTPVISVSRLLEHFGLDREELIRVREKYPHVFGRNKMANLPNVMKALDLHEWCFKKINSSDGQLLATYAMSYPNEDIDEEFVDAFKRIESSRAVHHNTGKVDFLKGIGFGENALTAKVLKHLYGTHSELTERYDCLHRFGMKHLDICLLIRRAPFTLCQNPKKLEQKLNFLCHETGSSIDYLNRFPAFFCYDLETRMKRRYRFYVWLRETGLCITNFSIVCMVSASEKKFLARLFRIHPAAPKQYLECF